MLTRMLKRSHSLPPVASPGDMFTTIPGNGLNVQVETMIGDDDDCGAGTALYATAERLSSVGTAVIGNVWDADVERD